MRLEDAVLLLDHHRHASAYYLAGYAVELALKAAISKQFFEQVIPDRTFVNAIHTHNLAELAAFAGLRAALTQARREPAFAANWSVTIQWSETSRYEMIDVFRANELVSAIRDPTSGVMEWLKRHW